MFLMPMCDFQELQEQHANTIRQDFPQNTVLLVRLALQVMTKQFTMKSMKVRRWKNVRQKYIQFFHCGHCESI